MLDEVKDASDIVAMWHIDYKVAEKVYDIFEEVISGQILLDISEDAAVYESIAYENDNLDTSSDSE